jgi:hypothetical protein
LKSAAIYCITQLRVLLDCSPCACGGVKSHVYRSERSPRYEEYGREMRRRAQAARHRKDCGREVKRACAPCHVARRLSALEKARVRGILSALAPKMQNHLGGSGSATPVLRRRVRVHK